MSDLFHVDVPPAYIQQVFDVMHRANWHQYQVLTKRSERLLELNAILRWQPQIWMGVSVENEDYFFRIDDLRKTNAHIKFLSVEPLLGPVDKIDSQGIDWVIAEVNPDREREPSTPAGSGSYATVASSKTCDSFSDNGEESSIEDRPNPGRPNLGRTASCRAGLGPAGPVPSGLAPPPSPQPSAPPEAAAAWKSPKPKAPWNSESRSPPQKPSETHSPDSSNKKSRHHPAQTGQSPQNPSSIDEVKVRPNSSSNARSSATFSRIARTGSSDSARTHSL